MIQIPKASTKWEFLKQPEGKYRKIFYYISISKKTEIAVMSLTLVNLIILAIDFENPPELLNEVGDYINTIIIFTIILEVIIKMFGLSLSGYFANSWNRFDFFIAITSIADVSFTLSSNGDGRVIKILKNFQILRILRMVRATR